MSPIQCAHVRDRWKHDQQIVQHPLRIGTHQDPYHPVTLVSRRNFSKKSCLNPPSQEKSPCLVVFKLGIPIYSNIQTYKNNHFMIFMFRSPCFGKRTAVSFPWGQSSGGLEIQGRGFHQWWSKISWWSLNATNGVFMVKTMGFQGG